MNSRTTAATVSTSNVGQQNTRKTTVRKNRSELPKTLYVTVSSHARVSLTVQGRWPCYEGRDFQPEM